MRAKDTSEYTEHKIKLESDLQLLEMCMEEMKAVYLLNQEKLSYNFQVLGEKVVENSKYLSRLKQQKARYMEKLSITRRAYQEKDKEYANKNIELTDKYKKST